MYLKRERSLVVNVVRVASVENVTVKSAYVRVSVCVWAPREKFVFY
jgi:hypothetical protein